MVPIISFCLHTTIYTHQNIQHTNLLPSLIMSSTSAATKMSRLVFNHYLAPRIFSNPANLAASTKIVTALSPATVAGFRYLSSSPPTAEDKPKPQNSQTHQDAKAIVSYWGVTSPKFTREDGSAWPWNCFRPWESYKADTSIDVKKHHTPVNFMDKFAYWTVQVLKYPTYIFFQRRHMCHAMLLETVAAVPGMVGGMLLHCKSLRRFEHSGGWIKALLEEAENERMHLMTFIDISQPKWYERALVFAVQGFFFNFYFLTYVVSPKLAHRITGYLEEEAVNSYTEFLKDLDNGSFENVPAPAIAIDYWRLPANATLRDVIVVIRADEAHHRDINHYASDIQCQGMELKEAAAPIGYH